MNRQNTPILFLKPVMKQMVWGGEKLRTAFSYEIPSRHTGEAWVVSALPDGDCMITDGIYQGKMLSNLYKEHPELFGDVQAERFPLMVKILDAKEDLSIQVHPDEAYARAFENNSWGKTESWYILDCVEDARLVVGHHAKTKKELHERIEAGEWQDLVREIPIQKGDFLQIDAGMVHIIKAGSMILEVQRSSNITYRLYDYGRLQEGRPRELHVEKGLDVITVPSKPVKEVLLRHIQVAPNIMHVLNQNEYYQVWELRVDQQVILRQEYPFLICSVVNGEGTIDGRSIGKGSHFILPAGYGEFTLRGDLQMIFSAVS